MICTISKVAREREAVKVDKALLRRRRGERAGMLGIAIATSEMAVGSRCIHGVAGISALRDPTVSSAAEWLAAETPDR